MVGSADQNNSGLKALIVDDHPIVINACGGAIDRDDKRYQLEATVDWRSHKRFGYEMSLSRERRDSSCFVFEYKATVLSAGVRFGWF